MKTNPKNCHFSPQFFESKLDAQEIVALFREHGPFIIFQGVFFLEGVKIFTVMGI